MAADWYTHEPLDVRWRMWILTEYARHADGLGTFAEFGTYRGGCAYMVLATTTVSELHLFDTFAGIPGRLLTADERRAGFEGRLADTSVEHVRRRLGKWAGRCNFHVGDVFDTLEAVETGPIALAHVDLNAAQPTRKALEYVYPRLVPSGMIVFDDYGSKDFVEQRKVIDEFFGAHADQPIALPTGQAVVVRRG